MKWFKHFANSHNNNKLTKVRMKYGAEGYAIYWYCLELISGDLGTQENINFELKHDAEVIGYNLKIDSVRVEEIMRYMIDLDLFEDADGVITCFRLAKYLDKKTTRNNHIHKIIDAANVSATVRDNPRLSVVVPDCPASPPLDTDTDTDTELKAAKRKRFTPPTLDELKAHAKAKGYTVNCESFHSFYESNGWRVGKNKMRSWQHAMAGWQSRESDSTKSKQPDERRSSM